MIGKRSRGAGLDINFWPSYTDIGMLMILILILFLFIQIASNTQAFKLQKMKEKQSQVANMLKVGLEAKGKGDVYSIEPDLNFQRITFSDKILFDSASADLKEDGEFILAIIGNVLRENAKAYASIRIEGHTDNVPLAGGRFRSNWDLSSSRATAVVEFLNKQTRLDPTGGKLYAAGYSEFKPVAQGADNDSPDNRTRNRRIEMIINYAADEPH